MLVRPPGMFRNRPARVRSGSSSRASRFYRACGFYRVISFCGRERKKKKAKSPASSRHKNNFSSTIGRIPTPSLDFFFPLRLIDEKSKFKTKESHAVPWRERVWGSRQKGKPNATGSGLPIHPFRKLHGQYIQDAKTHPQIGWFLRQAQMAFLARGRRKSQGSTSTAPRVSQKKKDTRQKSLFWVKSASRLKSASRPCMCMWRSKVVGGNWHGHVLKRKKKKKSSSHAHAHAHAHARPRWEPPLLRVAWTCRRQPYL